MTEPKRRLVMTPLNIFDMKKDDIYHLAIARGYKRAIKKMESMRPYVEPEEMQTLNDLLHVLRHDLDRLTYSEHEHDEFPNAS